MQEKIFKTFHIYFFFLHFAETKLKGEHLRWAFWTWNRMETTSSSRNDFNRALNGTGRWALTLCRDALIYCAIIYIFFNCESFLLKCGKIILGILLFSQVKDLKFFLVLTSVLNLSQLLHSNDINKYKIHTAVAYIACHKQCVCVMYAKS